MIIKSSDKKNIVLIESRSPGSHIYSKVLLPRLGILLMGTILSDKGYNVTVFIENFHEIDWKVVGGADIVCISVITCTAPRGYKLAAMCKKMGKKVIIGGSHSTFMAKESAQYADYVCVFESEWSLPQLVDAIFLDNINPLSIKGLVFEDKHNRGSVVQTGPPRVVTESDMDAFPFPDFSLIYGRPKMSTMPIISSRGCPHSCDFCSVIVMFGRKMRYRSDESVIEEIKYQSIGREDPGQIFFYDDNFAINKTRTARILEKIMSIPEGRRPKWMAQIDVGAAKDKELVRLMKRSGCMYVYVGFESVNEQTLAAYNKKQNLEEIETCIKTFNDEGINVHGMFVLDSRNDDQSVIDKTSDFIKRMDIATMQLLNMTPLPGTPLWAKEEKNLLTRDWSLFDGHHLVLKADKMPTYEMQIETIRAMKRFYSLPRALQKLVEGNWPVAGLRALGWNIVRKWAKDNKNFLELLMAIDQK